MTAAPLAAVAPADLRIESLSARYRGAAEDAVSGVDLAVRGGTVHALIGENGAGKSTLLKVLAGELAARSGRILLDGRVHAPADPAAAHRAGIGLIHQELSLAPHLDVAANIVLGAEPRCGPLLRPRLARAAGRRALARLGRADLPLHRRAADLSPGQRQIVEIARAIHRGSRVLLLDEPTSSLTHEDKERLLALVDQLRRSGYAVIYISHALDEVRRVAASFTVLRDGRCAGSGELATTSDEELLRLMVGRPLAPRQRAARRPGPPLLTVAGVGGRGLPHAASLTVCRGEVVGLFGLMGAGRTELLRCLFRLEPIRRGEVRLGGAPSPPTTGGMWRAGAGMVSEDRRREGLALACTAAANVAWPRLPATGGWVSHRRLEQAAAAAMRAVDVRCRSPRQVVGELSGGNQQKVALARLLHARCDLWLVDEPTRGIDVGAKVEIYALIDRLVTGDPAAAVLLVSSELPELLAVCDRIAVMRRGRLLAARPAADWSQEGLLRAAAVDDTEAR